MTSSADDGAPSPPEAPRASRSRPPCLWQDRNVASEHRVPSERLDALAHAYGIVPSRSGVSQGTRATSEATVVAALAAFGIDASSPEKVEVALAHRELDRKSTRLNSSHVKISYAVFCLKKKKKQ